MLLNLIFNLHSTGNDKTSKLAKDIVAFFRISDHAKQVSRTRQSKCVGSSSRPSHSWISSKTCRSQNSGKGCLPVNITIENETISAVEEISEKKTLNVLTVRISKQIDQFR